jgi:hypothetical protein
MVFPWLASWTVHPGVAPESLKDGVDASSDAVEKHRVLTHVLTPFEFFCIYVL